MGSVSSLVVQSDGTPLGTPMVTLPVPQNYSERGLLGVAAHPAFTSNGFIYLYYTTRQNGFHNRVSRFTVSGNTASGEVVLADLPLVTSFIHNGGGMHFGPDGKLYVAVGDDAVSANAQDLKTPLGKMLRLNDDGSIPADNPFCTTQGNLACAVWAYGLRSPFTFAFQPGTGRMHINDVGASLWEEIDVGARGANYGWPQTEGPTTASGIAAPLFAYSHSEASPPGTGPGGFFVGICVIGGDFHEQVPFANVHFADHVPGQAGLARDAVHDVNWRDAHFFPEVHVQADELARGRAVLFEGANGSGLFSSTARAFPWRS
jgi:glucose/arabinose dehydrogenase